MDKLYRVVIIDDDEFSADNLCLELKKYNRLSIDGMARNGVNGRKLLEKVHPDLLFLDVELPDMKGMELLEQIRGAITCNMQIVFYTAYSKAHMQKHPRFFLQNLYLKIPFCFLSYLC